MIVKFKFDKEKDLRNIWETANTKPHYGYDFRKNVTRNILEICEGREYEDCKKDLSRVMNSFYRSSLVGVVVKSVGDAWKGIEKEYFKRLEKLTGEKFPFGKVDAYLTTSGRCPYDCSSKSPSFHFNFFWGIPMNLQTAGHELMHLHLHNFSWWENVEDKIGNKGTHDLKEALTELLNLDFRDLWFVHNKGYSGHVKLRSYISSQWKKKKDFDLLTNNCVKWIKRNGVK